MRLRTVVQSISAGDFSTDATVEFIIYEFGAVSVAYRIPLRASLEHLLHLSDTLYDNARLLADSRRGVEQLVATISPAINRPFITDLVEDYVIFQVDAVENQIGDEFPDALARHQCCLDRVHIVARCNDAHTGGCSFNIQPNFHGEHQVSSASPV